MSERNDPASAPVPIRVGIGGWSYEPWRGTFYPPGLPRTRELEHAGAHLTAIEINATFYRLQSPKSFAKWRDAVPPGFVFALKASRYCTNRRNLAEAEESIARFLGQGLTELGDKLGPINWQLAGTKRFDADEIAAFLALLPPEREGLPLRHAIEARHESFRDPAFFELARRAGVAAILADSDRYPRLDEQTAPFVYARLQRAREELPDGYGEGELDHWAEQARAWVGEGRETFIFFINGAKIRAPAAAQALIARLA